jgi:steroid delta-isomerase-like uncharacterized protein
VHEECGQRPSRSTAAACEEGDHSGIPPLATAAGVAGLEVDVTVIDRVAAFHEIWDGVWHSPRAASVIAESYTDDFLLHISSLPEPIDRAAFASFAEGWQRAFQEGRMEILDLIASGDRVWCYWLSTGIHRAEYLGIPATGRQVAYAGVDIYRFEGTRIAECWAVPDVLTLLRQLGVVSR